MGNLSSKFPIINNQLPNKFQSSISNNQTKAFFGHWNLVIVPTLASPSRDPDHSIGSYFLVIVSWLLVILLGGCGEIEGKVDHLEISPPWATIGVNQDQLFSVIGEDENGFIVEVEPSWSVSGGIGTISPGSPDSSYATFYAGSNPGEGYVVASYEGKTASAAVTVTEKGWFTGRVTDNKGNLVPDMKVYLKENTSLFDFTDSSGDYLISDVPAGTYEVWTIETAVYRATSKEASVGRGETVTVNLPIYYFTDPPDFNPPEYTP